MEHIKELPFKPYKYQELSIQETLYSDTKTVICLPTGAGKTITSCFLIKEWQKNNPNKKVLITCHRIELVEQFVESLNEVGLTTETIIAGKKKYKHDSEVYVSMVETLNNKLEKDAEFLKDISLVISDECHILVHEKIYGYYPSAKIIGLTATPCLEERESFYKCKICDTNYDENTECHGEETLEYGKQKTLSSIYDEIVTNINIQELIYMGQLVKEINFKIDIDLSSLKEDRKGEFSNKSLNETYNNEVAVYDVVKNYEEVALGKRTIIFNANTKVNLEVYKQFIDKGYNVRMYDSVNTPNVNRKELVEWYSNNDDAILCNVASFVAGFDSREIECVILNMATMSLSKYIQCVGRGGRSSKKIYKPHFICIDLGGNVDRFGEWSSDSWDWKDIFYNGNIKPKARQENIEIVKECVSCGALFPRSLFKCNYCGFQAESQGISIVNKVLSNEIAKIVSIPKPPQAKKIIEYAKSLDKDKSFTYKIFFNQLVDLFRYSQMSEQDYEKVKSNGKLKERIREICRPAYFVFLKCDLEYGSNIKLETFIEKGLKKVEKYYEKKIRK